MNADKNSKISKNSRKIFFQLSMIQCGKKFYRSAMKQLFLLFNKFLKIRVHPCLSVFN